MANPPFNVDGVDKEKIKDDKRYELGMPANDNANYLWIENFYSALKSTGRAGFVMSAAAGDAGNVNYEYVTYEGYGPSGIAIIVDALTDNKNRTAANIRSAFTKGQGSIGTPGCVSFMFDKKGQIIIDKEECDLDADDLMMQALDAGAEDFSEEEDSFEIVTDPDSFEAVEKALKEAGILMASAEVTMIPQNYVSLTDEVAIKNLQRTLDLLDDDDDVQAVYHNWDE